MSLSSWDYLSLLLLCPIFAIIVVVSFICVGWWLAWKLVLVHVPMVQEIFGLKKKPVQLKPPTRRISKIYSTINVHNSASKYNLVVSCVFEGRGTADTKICLFDATKQIGIGNSGA